MGVGVKRGQYSRLFPGLAAAGGLRLRLRGEADRAQEVRVSGHERLREVRGQLVRVLGRVERAAEFGDELLGAEFILRHACGGMWGQYSTAPGAIESCDS